MDNEVPAEDSAEGSEAVAERANDGPSRHRQAALLRELARRLELGEATLPTDVFAHVAREVELRLDDDAITEAYEEQRERKAEPWVFCRGRVQG